MKSGKSVCIAMAAVMVLTVSGCKGKKTDESKAPFFALAETVYTQDSSAVSVCNRYNTAYTDTLSPSEGYGALAVFSGGVNIYTKEEDGKTSSIQNPLYGLMTESGAVVVDAVYDAVIKHISAEGDTVYELIKGSDGTEVKKSERYAAAGDGSWVFKMPKNTYIHSVGANRVILKRVRYSGKKTYEYFDFYDFSGKRKFTLESKLCEDKNTVVSIGSFGEWLLPVNITVKTPNEKKDGEEQTYSEESRAYYIDNSGKKLLEGFTYCGEFKNGYAVAADENGLYGVIKPNGEWFIEPHYKNINYNATKGLFACADDGFYDILDTEKKSVKKVICVKGSVEILDGEPTVYKKINADTDRTEYFYLDSGKPFTCIENGMFPNSDREVGGLYVGYYSGTGTIFDTDGASIASIGDFGELADRFGNTAVVTNSTGKKVCFVSVSSKQRGEWLDMSYTGQSLDGRYLVLKKADALTSGYSLYDLLTESFVYSDCDYIEVTGQNGEFVSIVNGRGSSVLDSKLNVILSVGNAD